MIWAILKGITATRNGLMALGLAATIASAFIGNWIGHVGGKRAGVAEYKADVQQKAGKQRAKANRKARRANRPGSRRRLLKRWCRDC